MKAVSFSRMTYDLLSNEETLESERDVTNNYTVTIEIN